MSIHSIPSKIPHLLATPLPSGIDPKNITQPGTLNVRGYDNHPSNRSIIKDPSSKVQLEARQAQLVSPVDLNNSNIVLNKADITLHDLELELEPTHKPPHGTPRIKIFK
ncbi:hypothetical protein HOH45_08215 [bacterium]|jgi:hypothetical protein|nr:hypothetical protein [bacterium]